jgi:predicted NBD/HSP70 family sugar kinase
MVLIPSTVGRINKRALLGHLQRIGQASRADLAKSLGLSQPTTGKIADELLRLGVLEEVEEVVTALPLLTRAGNARGKIGRPGRILRLNRTQPRFLAIQLDVSETNLAALPVGVEPEDHWTFQTETPSSADAWVRQLKAVAENIPPHDYWGVLVSVPGIVDELRARVLFSPNLHWTEAVELPALIQQVWQVPVELVQEERALALGQLSADDKEEDFLLVDFGEGVGGAAIVSGRLYTSTLPLSGELGHTPVLRNRRKCGCGAVGCIETLVSKRGLIQSYASAHHGARPAWESLQEAVAAHGIPQWLTRTLDATGDVIAGALNVTGLRRLILTGIPTEPASSAVKYLCKAIMRGAMWARFGELSIETAPRRRAAGLVAVGIDRLALPMEKNSRTEEMSLPTPAPNRSFRGWLSYKE